MIVANPFPTTERRANDSGIRAAKNTHVSLQVKEYRKCWEGVGVWKPVCETSGCVVLHGRLAEACQSLRAM